MSQPLSSLEICAGAGGQALGLEMAGFEHASLVELEEIACETLRYNRPQWEVRQLDVRDFSATAFGGIDLFAGGVPCPPFSIAGKQLGGADERDLFPTALRLIEESKPRAVLLENVVGLSTTRFSDYRKSIADRLTRMGYDVDWQVLNACNFGVPQLRPRFILVGIRGKAAHRFRWPQPVGSPVTVGDALGDLMAIGGWEGAKEWRDNANGVAPTLVGGSKKHGGPDVGPTRAREAWARLGVNGKSIAQYPPNSDFPRKGLPRLTPRMGARIQGFPDHWEFQGKKTAVWRQIGNAFPPPVAAAVGTAIANALNGVESWEPDSQIALPLARQ